MEKSHFLNLQFHDNLRIANILENTVKSMPLKNLLSSLFLLLASFPIEPACAEKNIKEYSPFPKRYACPVDQRDQPIVDHRSKPDAEHDRLNCPYAKTRLPKPPIPETQTFAKKKQDCIRRLEEAKKRGIGTSSYLNALKNIEQANIPAHLKEEKLKLLVECLENQMINLPTKTLISGNSGKFYLKVELIDDSFPNERQKSDSRPFADILGPGVKEDMSRKRRR